MQQNLPKFFETACGVKLDVQQLRLKIHSRLQINRYRLTNYFFGKDDERVRTRRKFGEVAIIRDGRKAVKGKLQDRGRPVLYVGSADDHANDVHRFMTLDTQRVVYSRDVTWLNQVYGDWKGLTDPRVNIPDDEVVTMDQDEEETTSTPEQEQRDDIDPKLARELKKLDGWDTKEKTLSDRVKEMTQAPEGMATRSSTKEASGGGSDDAAKTIGMELRKLFCNY